MGPSPTPWCLPCVLLVSLAFSPAWAAFNCTRPGTGCHNGGVCDPTGMCTCIGGTFAGFDCSLPQHKIMVGGCMSSNPCQHGATCYEDSPAPGMAATTKCYCPYEFYGAYCELPTVQNQCLGDKMIVNVFPGPSFWGVVGLQYPAGLCELPLTSTQHEVLNDPARSHWQGYGAVLPYSVGLCKVKPTSKVVGAEITYTYDVMVRYDRSGTKPEMDEIVSFSCTLPYDKTATAGPSAVLFSVTDARGQLVDRPRLGSPFTISFTVDPTSTFSDVAVKSCTVSNALKTTSKYVVYDFCPVTPFGSSLVKQGDKHVLTLVTHMFGRDPTLTFECNVKVCTTADHSCQQLPTCPALKPKYPAVNPAYPAGPAAPGSVPGSSDPAFNDILGLLGPSSPGTASSLSLNDLLGAAGTMGLNELLAAPPPHGHAHSYSSASASSGPPAPGSQNHLLGMGGMGSLNDLLFSTGGQSPTAPVRRRRDVIKDNDVIVVGGTLLLSSSRF
nr:zona pellucida domain-containing protein [Crepidula fornicata]